MLLRDLTLLEEEVRGRYAASVTMVGCIAHQYAQWTLSIRHPLSPGHIRCALGETGDGTRAVSFLGRREQDLCQVPISAGHTLA